MEVLHKYNVNIEYHYSYDILVFQYQRRTNIFQGVGTEAEGGLTSRGSEGAAPQTLMIIWQSHSPKSS